MSRRTLFLLALLAWSPAVWAQTITTVAGGGPNDVPAASANVFPTGLAVRNGDLYIANGSLNRVYRVDSSDRLWVAAGNGISSSDGDGGLATWVGVLDPRSIALDAAGNMWIGESVGRVRRVDAFTGIITTVAGTDSSGFSGDGGPATSATLRNASGVALDTAGNLFIADTNNHRIRRVDALTGIITTYAGNGVQAYSGDNGPAASASLRAPLKVAVDKDGNLLIADTGNNRIRRVAAGTGIITTVAGNGVAGLSGDLGPATAASLRSPSDMAGDSAGNIWIADTANSRIRRVDGSTGIITTHLSGLNGPSTVAFAGNTLFVGNTNAFKVMRLNLNGLCCGDVGNGSLGYSGENVAATAASLRFPNNLAFDGEGNVYIADSSNNRVRRVAVGTGIITTVAGISTSGFNADGIAATSASLSNPVGVALDAAGNLYIADQNNFRIRRVDAVTGVISTVAGTGLTGFTGDGGPAVSARISQVTGIAVDASGNIFLADRANQRIRKIDGTTSIITTFAGSGTSGLGDGGPATSARLANPGDVAVDAAGNVFIADTSNNRIRRVDRMTSLITTVAGGGLNTAEGVPAIQASIVAAGVKVDGQGNIYIAGNTRHRVQKVNALTQTIHTIAGNGQFAFTGDGGPATVAGLANPTGVAVDSAGNIAIADSNNHRVRLVLAANTVPAVTISSGATIDEGSFIAVSGSFTDSDANSWTATVNFGDGSGTAPLPLAADKTFNLNHVYSDNGTYTITVTVDDGVGGIGSATATVIVLNVAPGVNAGSNGSINEGAAFTRSGSFVDPGSDTWNGSVDFGDGSAIQALTLGAHKTFSLSHVYADSGTYPVTVWINDDDTAAGTTTIQVAVNNVAPVISTLGTNVASVEENDVLTLSGSFTDAGALDSHTVTIKWGDGSTDTNLNLAAGQLNFSVQHTYMDDRPTATTSDMNTIEVTIVDKDSGSASQSTSISVKNASPMISQSMALSASMALGSAPALDVNYADKGSLDTHVCVYSWNDGQPDTTVAGSAGSCSATHTFRTPGTHNVDVMVIDDDNGSARATFSIEVAVAPTTGFVTGGGWINSPAGAFLKDPSISRRANFGFNARYAKNAAIPTGQTEFNFKIGNLNFHSTRCEWLVITGNEAQYQGSGTVNGSGDYSFMVTAVDGVDALRMVIWDKRTGSVIYDNSLGQGNPQPIGGGSITIHSR